MRVVLASSNAGKLREFADLLTPLKLTVVSQADLGVPSPEETGLTFIENALLKARNAAQHAGYAALADDSGIVVPALGGTPGIYSARYAGVAATDLDNNAKLIDDLSAVTDRRAYFYCAIVYLQNVSDPTPIVSCAAWHGEIIDTPRGNGGFGYDPHFLIPNLGCTSAELTKEQKNALSHRGQAVQGLVAQLRQTADR